MQKDSEVIEREVKIMKMLHDFVELNKLNMAEALSRMLSFAMTLCATQNVPPEKVKGILDETYSTYKAEALSTMLNFAMTLFATQNVPPEKVKGILDETYSTYKKVYKIKNPL